MSAEVLEIVQLEDGAFALRRSEEGAAKQEDGKQQTPMISIRFSEQAEQEFDGGQAELAKAMMALGVQVIVENREKQLLAALAPTLH